jgi:hypothetical protein
MLCLILLVALTSFRIHAQTVGSNAPSALVSKDPAAVTVIQTALSAMNPTQAALNYVDSVATGTMTTFYNSQRVDTPVTLKSKGTLESRIETQTAKGTNIGISNNGPSASLRPDGSVRRAKGINTLIERVDYIPLFSFLSEWQNPNVLVESVGPAAIANQPANVVALSLAFGNVKSGQQLSLQTTRTLFYIDQATNTVSKIEFALFPDDGSRSAAKMEILLADYRNVGEILVPFQQTTYQDGKPDSRLTLSSVAFNVGLSDNDFVLP